MSGAKRYPGADLIRILALFFVISVHFFLNNRFYYATVLGPRMYVMLLMRALFIICVPLFMLLSGYLLSGKKLELSYYGRIGKIVLTYVLAALLCVAYTIFFQDESRSVREILLGILDFSAAPYSWYVEMYCGLFLLIPLLNILYHAMGTQKRKLCLLLTFISLTFLPAGLNVYYLRSFDWLLQPSTAPAYEFSAMFPDYWISLYPLAYYFIGCYLREYGLKINRLLNLGLIVATILFAGTYSYWRSYGSIFLCAEWCSYYSPTTMILSVLIFVFFTNINYEKLPNGLVSFISKVSGLCLGAYLVSWVFDSYLYPILLEHTSTVTHRLEYYFVIVPIVFLASLLTSYLLSKIQLLIEKAFGLLLRLFRKKTKSF